METTVIIALVLKVKAESAVNTQRWSSYLHTSFKPVNEMKCVQMKCLFLNSLHLGCVCQSTHTPQKKGHNKNSNMQM